MKHRRSAPTATPSCGRLVETGVLQPDAAPETQVAVSDGILRVGSLAYMLHIPEEA
jgi:hypothetical protein